MTGRPPFDPTNSQRADVRLLKADGWSDDRIARRLGISRTTLLKHFCEELETGADQERQEALKLLKRAAKKLNVTAIRELLKVTGAMATLEDIINPAGPTPRKRPAGRKEVAHQEAMTAHLTSDWGEDLAPLSDKKLN